MRILYDERRLIE